MFPNSFFNPFYFTPRFWWRLTAVPPVTRKRTGSDRQDEIYNYDEAYDEWRKKRAEWRKIELDDEEVLTLL